MAGPKRRACREAEGITRTAPALPERVASFMSILVKSKSESASLAFFPDEGDLASLKKAARGCQACPLWEAATQVVFGEGPPRARLFLVGEQPGDEEDIKGHPFVGPAGRVLDAALTAAGIDRDHLYMTNAVKHFKYEPRGKRRIHSKPSYTEVQACNGWLRGELAAVSPAVVVCLGATAAQAFMGRTFAITKTRGRWVETPLAARWMATWHPSAILRGPDQETRDRMREELIGDLRVAKQALIT
jgi:uracil-DNA glycosylase family protein